MLSGCQPGITKAAGILRALPWRRRHCRLRCRSLPPPQLATDAAGSRGDAPFVFEGSSPRTPLGIGLPPEDA